MDSVKSRRILFAVGCFAMFAVTSFFVLESMDLFNGEYDDMMLPVIVYFTIQTNIFVALWALYLGLKTVLPKMRRVPSFLSMIVTVNITVTGIVYWLILAPMLGFGVKPFSLSNIWMHTVAPVFMIVMFFFVCLKEKRLALRGLH